MKKLIIFDLDGTVLDSVDDLMISANKVRELHKLKPFDKKAILSCIGDGVQVFVDKLFSDVSVTPDNALAQFTTYYKEHIADFTTPFEGIVELLQYLNRKGNIVGILSNKSEDLTKKVLKLLKIDKLFRFTYGGDSFKQKKPSSLPVLEILKQFDINFENAVIIGDSPNDIKAGKGANISTIAVGYGYTDKEILLKYKPDYLVDFPLDIKTIL
jgi:phosphoglycolate phosphatase